ncbi:hypothetical protein ACFQFQ_14960 [Sulfitobacter porphyrae]|uniref:Uncharacterized protein n=1 Tax=Sulfitobacter porphyrae TaxID=1246864 RepID=A0ABW2B4E8_9RHOB
MQTKTRPVVSDRLVLTPALRVAEPDVETPDKADDAMAQDWSEEDAAFEAAYGEDASDETSIGTGPAPDTAAGDEALSAAPDVAGDPDFGDIETDLDDPALDYETDPYNFADDADQDGEGAVTATPSMTHSRMRTRMKPWHRGRMRMMISPPPGMTPRPQR